MGLFRPAFRLGDMFRPFLFLRKQSLAQGHYIAKGTSPNVPRFLV